jgi:hypothetical protein
MVSDDQRAIEGEAVRHNKSNGSQKILSSLTGLFGKCPSQGQPIKLGEKYF